MGRSWTHPWSQKSTGTYEITPSENTWKLHSPLTTKDNRAALSWVGETGRDSLARNPTPGVLTYSEEDLTDTEFFPEEWVGLCPASGNLTLGTWTRDMSPKNICLWKPKGLTSRRMELMRGTEILLLKDSGAGGFTHFRTQPKGAVWKVLRPHVKESHLLITEHLLDRQDPVRTFCRSGGAGSHHFCIPPLPCLCRPLWHHFCALSLKPGLHMADAHIPPRGCPLSTWLWWPGRIMFGFQCVWNNPRNSSQ